MPDMHVLAGGDGEWAIVMHFDVASADNAVGISYRTALVASGLGGATSLPDGDGTGGTIAAAEKTQIEVGQVVEYRVSFPVESGGSTAAQLRASLQEFYEKENAAAIARLQAALRYFGHTEARA